MIIHKENKKSHSSKQQDSFMLLSFWMEDGVRLMRKNEGNVAGLLEDVEIHGEKKNRSPTLGSGNPLRSAQRSLTWVVLQADGFSLPSG